MKRLVAIANGISPPGTMGGNSKIILEMLRNIPGEWRTLVVTTKPAFFSENGVAENARLKIIAIPFREDEMRSHFSACSQYLRDARRVFSENGVGADDTVYCTSDFFVDVWPGFVLQKEFGFKWVPSFYLFVPSVFENLRRRCGFPVLKYIFYWFYQKFSHLLITARCSGVVVTNDADIARFPKRLRDKILAIYGGVNTEQIPDEKENGETKYDAVFCSRLHPQKGVSGLLDVWRGVADAFPTAKLALIGNGAPEYEAFLKNKTRKLGLDANTEWLGYVNNEAKYRIYHRSKMLLHSTVYDNNGMVAAEALCAGLPVVMYDLPELRRLYSDGCVKVPRGDTAEYAASVSKLLTEKNYYDSAKPTPEQIAALREKWNWTNRAALFFYFMRIFQANNP